MADIFLSYARRDREVAEKVKEALEAAGLSVFFDVEGLDGGDVFPDVLDREVKSAGAVISLWSQHSLSRPWVKQECSIGLKRRCLIPLTIEALGELDVPVAFEGVQQIDFTGFHGRTDTAEWRRLMRSLSRTLGRPELADEAVPARTSAKAAVKAKVPVQRTPKRPAAPWLIFGVLAVGVIGAIAARQYLADNKIAELEQPETAETAAADAADQPAAEAVPAGPEDEPMAAAPAPAGVTALQPGEACGDVSARIYFDFDKTSLTMEAQSVLEEALTAGFDCELLEVRIEAHDDLQNSPSYAEGVSQRRADTIAQWLGANGVTAERIMSIGYGSSQPLAPGQRSPANRRADVIFDLESPVLP